MLASPVPTQTVSWFEGSRVTSPIDMLGASSNTHSHETPSLMDFQTPEDAPATYSV